LISFDWPFCWTSCIASAESVWSGNIGGKLTARLLPATTGTFKLATAWPTGADTAVVGGGVGVRGGNWEGGGGKCVFSLTLAWRMDNSEISLLEISLIIEDGVDGFSISRICGMRGFSRVHSLERTGRRGGWCGWRGWWCDGCEGWGYCV
jgi:hypothetical protein